MTMDETYPGEIFEQEEPKQIIPPGSAQPTHDAHQ